MRRLAFVVGLIAVQLGVLVSARTQAAPAQDALTMLRAALGGDAAIDAVQTIRARGKIKFQPNDDHFDIAVALPDRFLSTVRMLRVHDASWSTQSYVESYLRGWPERTEPMLVGGGESPQQQVSGFNGDVLLPAHTAWSLQDSNAVPRVLDGTRAMMAEFVLPLLAGTSASYRVVARSEAYAVRFSAVGGREWRLELDPLTHLPARMTWTYPLIPGAPKSAKQMTGRVEYSDFRIVGGLQWPHRLITQRDSRPVEEATIQRYEVNVKLSDKMFRK